MKKEVEEDETEGGRGTEGPEGDRKAGEAVDAGG